MSVSINNSEPYKKHMVWWIQSLLICGLGREKVLVIGGSKGAIGNFLLFFVLLGDVPSCLLIHGEKVGLLEGL